VEAREAGHAEERAAGVCEPGGRVCERQRQDGHATLAGVAGGAHAGQEVHGRLSGQVDGRKNRDVVRVTVPLDHRSVGQKLFR